MPGAIGADEIYSGDQFVKIEEFLERLAGVQKSGGGWVACCPAHGDSNPSLSISESGNRILVHCHAGCSAAAIVESMGLKMKDLFTDSAEHGETIEEAVRNDGGAAERAALGAAALSIRPDDGGGTKPKKKSGSHGKWVCDYDYVDESGQILYKASRYVQEDGRKTFTIKRPDPESKYGWSFGLRGAGIKRVPFRLDRVVAAAAKKRANTSLEFQNVKGLGEVIACARIESQYLIVNLRASRKNKHYTIQLLRSV